ncbi:MAG: hypothetical protein ACTHOB_01065 [Ginsengibacter sp.]
MLHQTAVIIGYLASVLLGISLMMNDDLKFRWINAFGCLFFIIYGFMISAFPIVLTNAFLLLINIYYLVKIYRTMEDLELMEFKGDEQLVHKFLKFYKKDIHHFFPDFVYEQNENNIRFVVLRDLVVANIFIAELKEGGTAVIKLNYTVPKYRDYKIDEFLFKKENKFLTGKGVKHILYESVSNKGYQRFLKKMNFQIVTTNGKNRFIRQI